MAENTCMVTTKILCNRVRGWAEQKSSPFKVHRRRDVIKTKNKTKQKEQDKTEKTKQKREWGAEKKATKQSRLYSASHRVARADIINTASRTRNFRKGDDGKKEKKEEKKEVQCCSIPHATINKRLPHLGWCKTITSASNS